MVIKVGITGGIGSGKTTVCKVFELLGAPVFSADIVAKELLNSNAKIISGLTEFYGNDIYFSNGKINRKKLAAVIFNNDVELKKVNNLIHPEVRLEFNNWISKQKGPYIIHEAAILFESGFYQMMDFTVLVTAPEKDRITRVTKRDGVNENQVKERMAKQWSDKQKRELASIEIVNDNKNLIIPQIVNIDKQLRAYGKIW